MTEPVLAPAHLRTDPTLDPDDLLTAATLARGMEHLTMRRPAPRPEGARILPGPRNASPAAGGARGRWAPLAAGGLTVAAVTAVVTVATQGAAPAAAWSATPTRASSGEQAAITATCTAALRRPFEAEQERASGRPGMAAAKGAVPPPPQVTQLPPLAVLDLRGAGAMAIFGDEHRTATCLVLRRDGAWEHLYLSASDSAPAPAPSAAVELGGHASTERPDGTTVSSLDGFTSPGVTGVRVELPGREPIVASLAGTRFAAWWPGAGPLTGGRVVALEGAREVGAVSLDVLEARKRQAEADRGGTAGRETGKEAGKEAGTAAKREARPAGS